MSEEERITERNVVKDKLTLTEHPKYDFIEVGQYILEIAKGDKIEVYLNGKLEKEWIGKYNNSHINLVYQAKEGLK